MTLDFPGNRLKKPESQTLPINKDAIFANETFCLEQMNCLEDMAESSEENPVLDQEVKEKLAEESESGENSQILETQNYEKNQKMKLRFPTFKLKIAV